MARSRYRRSFSTGALLWLGHIEHLANNDREPAPFFCVNFKLPAARASQLIVFGAPIVIACSPLPFNPAAPLEAMQRRVKRSLSNLERGGRDLMEAFRNSPAVQWLNCQRLQNQEVQCALRQLESFLIHITPFVLRQVAYFCSCRSARGGRPPKTNRAAFTHRLTGHADRPESPSRRANPRSQM